MATATWSRRRVEKRQQHEVALIDHLVRAFHDSKTSLERRIHAPLTASGQSVEAQIQKVWQRGNGGLALF